jgi:hypothetical protein
MMMYLWCVMTVGPKCKAHIRCKLCGQKIHKEAPKCKNPKWLSGCSKCNWYPIVAFKSRSKAMHHFRDHKHDAIWTYSETMQTALVNLNEAGITYTIE